MAAATRRKLSAQPNAGMPRDVGGRSMYMASPEYMASYARHLIQAGAKIVGGCCGTTPEHIRAMVQGVRPLAPRVSGIGNREPGIGRRAASEQAASSADSRFPIPVPDARAVAPIPFAERSHFAAKIARGEMVTSVEIVPPRGVDASKMLSDVAALKRAGVDAVNVPDGPRAQSRMGAVMTSLLIEQQVGIETVTHYCCRDRNLLGMLSDLLGASAMGLRNILLITGDPPKMGPYPDATAVFDIDAIGLTNLVSNLNRGLDPGGNPIGAPTRYAIGVGVNPAAVDPAHRAQAVRVQGRSGRGVRDHAAGVRRRAARALPRRDRARAHSRSSPASGRSCRCATPSSSRTRCRASSCPRAVITRMRRANEKSKEHAVAEGIAIAREMLGCVKSAVQGVQVSAPFGKVELALQVFHDHTRSAA